MFIQVFCKDRDSVRKYKYSVIERYFQKNANFPGGLKLSINCDDTDYSQAMYIEHGGDLDTYFFNCPKSPDDITANRYGDIIDIDHSLSDDIKRKIRKSAWIHPMIDRGIYSFSFDDKGQIIRGPDIVVTIRANKKLV